jgi:transposase
MAGPETAIVKVCFYVPQVKRPYADMAAHYGAELLPARPIKPRHKAKVEAAVLIVERWLLGRLRRCRPPCLNPRKQFHSGWIDRKTNPARRLARDTIVYVRQLTVPNAYSPRSPNTYG